MVEEIDTHVGRVIDQLEKDGELDNTVCTRLRIGLIPQFVIFMSDK